MNNDMRMIYSKIQASAWTQTHTHTHKHAIHTHKNTTQNTRLSRTEFFVRPLLQLPTMWKTYGIQVYTRKWKWQFSWRRFPVCLVL